MSVPNFSSLAGIEVAEKFGVEVQRLYGEVPESLVELGLGFDNITITIQNVRRTPNYYPGSQPNIICLWKSKLIYH